MNVHPLVIEDIIRRALIEDLGRGGDITSEAVIPADRTGKAVMRARETGILAGIEAATTAFRLCDAGLKIRIGAADGETLKAGQEIMVIEGPARAILAAERTALNIISHMSGIATMTGQYVAAVAGTGAKIVCTRKTLPGLRALQKYAVRTGGGFNHRFGLDDAMLIKDNHIALAGGIEIAIDSAIAKAGHMVKIEVEVDTLEQLAVALTYKIDAVLLDNMPPVLLYQAVEMVGGRVVTEASGGVDLGTVRAVAESGVDLISAGALTHSVAALDIGLDVE